MNEQRSGLERLGTGIAALDRVIDGGFPVQSITVIAGEPGAGKTVLALHTMFAAASRGKRCLYFTTLSEPSLKLLRYVQLFGFFDEHAMAERIKVIDLGSVLRAQDAHAALALVTESVEAEGAELVVIDSFKAIHDLIPETGRARTFTYDLAVHMAAWGATTLLVGEYADQEIATFPEFAIADGVIRLGIARQELARVRELEVRKLRGSGFAGGVHFYTIDARGMSFYPRVCAPEPVGAGGIADLSERVSTGAKGLDDLLRGGLPRASSTVVMGGTGTGKTVLGLQFLMDGTRAPDSGILFTLEESLDQLRGIALGLGIDLAGAEKSGALRMVYTPPVELSTDRMLDKILASIEATQARRLVLDSLSSLALGAVSDRRYKELVYSLSKHCRNAGVTLLMTMEISELLGAAQLSGHGVSFAADNVIQMRYVEIGGRLDRAISVIKARGVNVDTQLRPFEIGQGGIHIGAGEAFKGLRGVLTGVPVDVEGKR